MGSTRTLVGQAEANKPTATGQWFGYEVYDVDGDFALVIHISVYDGVRRTDHYAAPQQPLVALTRDEALQEAARATAAYARALAGEAST